MTNKKSGLEGEGSYTATMQALHNEPDLLGIYCVGAGRSGVARALLEARPKKKLKGAIA